MVCHANLKYLSWRGPGSYEPAEIIASVGSVQDVTLIETSCRTYPAGYQFPINLTSDNLYVNLAENLIQ